MVNEDLVTIWAAYFLIVTEECCTACHRYLRIWI